MKIKKLIIEGMHNVDKKSYTFSDLTYFVGSNGAGKSTILQGIQLALLGYIPGYSKTNEGIFQHCNGERLSVTLYIEINQSDSVIIQRTWTRSGSKITSNVNIIPAYFDVESIIKDVELPIYNFSDFINMTANKLKDWFIQFLPGSDDNLDWKSLFREQIKYDPNVDSTYDSLLETIVSSEPAQLKGIDGVRQMNTYLKNLLSFKKSEGLRIQDTIQSLIHYDDIPINKPIYELQSELNTVLQLISQAKSYQAAQKSNAQIELQLAAYQDLAETSSQDPLIPQLVSRIADLNVELQELLSTDYHTDIAKLQTEIQSRNAIIRGRGTCPYTHSQCGTIESLINNYTNEVQDLQNKLADLRQAQTYRDSKVQQLQADITSAQTKYNQQVSKYAQRDQLKSCIITVSNRDTSLDVDFLESRLKDLTDSISRVKANENYSDLIDTMTSKKFGIDQEIQMLNKLVKFTDANNLQTTMMEAPFINLANDMESYVNVLFNDADISVKFNLSSKANSFSFGIVRSQQYIPYDVLSSGEKCIFALAMMLCIVDKSYPDLKLILIDDMLDHLDDSKLQQLLNSLQKLDKIQLILAGVKQYQGDNWNDVVKFIK